MAIPVLAYRSFVQEQGQVTFHRPASSILTPEQWWGASPHQERWGLALALGKSKLKKNPKKQQLSRPRQVSWPRGDFLQVGAYWSKHAFISLLVSSLRLPFLRSVNRQLVMPSQTCWLSKQSWLWKVWLCSSGMPSTMTFQVGCSKFKLVALHAGSCHSSVFLCKIYTCISLLPLVGNWNISVRETGLSLALL